MEVLLVYGHPILSVVWLPKLREELTQPAPKFSGASLVSHPRGSPAPGYPQLVEATGENQPRLFCSVLFTMTLVISLAPIRSLRNCTALSQMKLLSFTVASATNKSTASRIFLLA